MSLNKEITMKCLVENGAVTQWPLNETHISNRGLRPPQVRAITPVDKPVVNGLFQVVYERKPVMDNGEPLQVWEVLDHPMSTVRTNSHAAVVAWIDDTTAKITGLYPKAEVASWGTKAEAARAVDAGNARADQTKIITDEASLTGRTVAEQATAIIARAVVFEEIISKSSGLRQATYTNIEAANTADDCQAVLEAAIAQAEVLVAPFGL